ncbi:MAG: hypothetical protein N4A35_06065 [Flavobacteriales bacterium]|jgi:hypothetical protein|nr:hypothetical protein [Flavobacteriales bacterium]
MKRIHLFELEDFNWFPNWIRVRLTRMLNFMHKLVKTEDKLIELLTPLIKESQNLHITDLCSGSGGPMIPVVERLQQQEQFKNLSLTLTDLYPHHEIVKRYESNPLISYSSQPVDVTKVNADYKGLKTMICSFHHMTPDNAKAILKAARDNRDTICIYEMSDNRHPLIANVFTFIFNFINSLFITPFVRPMSWQQLVFTYIIPILPLGFAWDGAVSNARTYTLSDIDELLEGLEQDDYQWEKGIIAGKLPSMYLIGKPV